MAATVEFRGRVHLVEVAYGVRVTFCGRRRAYRRGRDRGHTVSEVTCRTCLLVAASRERQAQAAAWLNGALA